MKTNCMTAYFLFIYYIFFSQYWSVRLPVVSIWYLKRRELLFFKVYPMRSCQVWPTSATTPTRCTTDRNLIYIIAIPFKIPICRIGRFYAMRSMAIGI